MVLFALAIRPAGTSGFIGEFLVILAKFQGELLVCAHRGTILVLGATTISGSSSA